MSALAAPPGMTALDGGTHRGIVWCTAASPLYGTVNGYVLVPADHPWHQLDYSDVDCDVHGGLTYDDVVPGGSGSWFGFDTMHAFDYWPGMPAYMNDRHAIRWTAEMVATEAQRLAEQAADASVIDAEIVEPLQELEG